MARIPDEVIGRIKQEVSVARLIEARGIELKRHGADLFGLCPFHDDHTPSLIVTPAKNVWRCAGACNTGGSAIDWVMKAEGISFRHAVELLRAGHPALMASAPVVKVGTVRRLAPPVEHGADDAQALEQIVSFYHQTLKESPEALEYLTKRGLTHAEMVGEFRLGFSNRTLGLRLPASNRKAGAEMRERLAKLGIIRDSGHEHFVGSLVIPVFDAGGAVVEMYGRKITENLRPGTPLHLYLPGEHRGVFNEKAFAASKEIILCESLIDALTFWCAGFRNVTASYGVNGFTNDHRVAFRKYGIRKVWIAYDRDEAGDNAAAALAPELMAMGIECFRVLFPKGMDANEYALKVQPAEKSLGLLLNKAEWMGKGKVSEATKEETTAEPVLPLAADTNVEVRGEEIVITIEGRRYRVRGFGKNTSHEMLKINLLASHGDRFFVDTLDLYAARQRAVFVKQAAVEMGINEEAVRRDVGRVLLKLEELQDEQIRKTLAPKQPETTMSEEERREAMELLLDPRLLERVLADYERCGVVGEETNKLVCYLAAISRRLEAPLAVVVQSSSAAGKSSLMEAAIAFVPEEERAEFSALTGQSLFYMGESDLKHKVLAIAEEEGASRASYALKLLQSEGALTIASTGKDPATGRLVTHQYRVEGPVMIFLTTTAIDLDEELLNRCLVLTVDEDRAQTQAIHRRQRELQTIEGLAARAERERILKVHRNAQRLLRPLLVANPYAHGLTFPDALTRTRRDHMKYLTLIRSIALLSQHQREVKNCEHNGRTLSYIEVEPSDIEMANRLAHEVLGRSLDELPPQTRRLLAEIDAMVASECKQQRLDRNEYRFSRRDVRAHTGWGDTQLKVHLHRLEELEYLAVHRGGRGQSFVYELVFALPADASKPHLPGLISVDKIDAARLMYDGNRAGVNGERSGLGRPQVGGVSGGGRVASEAMFTGAGVQYAACEA